MPRDRSVDVQSPISRTDNTAGTPLTPVKKPAKNKNAAAKLPATPSAAVDSARNEEQATGRDTMSLIATPDSAILTAPLADSPRRANGLAGVGALTPPVLSPPVADSPRPADNSLLTALPLDDYCKIDELGEPLKEQERFTYQNMLVRYGDWKNVRGQMPAGWRFIPFLRARPLDIDVDRLWITVSHTPVPHGLAHVRAVLMRAIGQAAKVRDGALAGTYLVDLVNKDFEGKEDISKGKCSGEAHTIKCQCTVEAYIAGLAQKLKGRKLYIWLHSHGYSSGDQQFFLMSEANPCTNPMCAQTYSLDQLVEWLTKLEVKVVLFAHVCRDPFTGETFNSLRRRDHSTRDVCIIFPVRLGFPFYSLPNDKTRQQELLFFGNRNVSITSVIRRMHGREANGDYEEHYFDVMRGNFRG